MKRTIKFLGLVALAVMLTFSLASCDTGGGGGGGFSAPGLGDIPNTGDMFDNLTCLAIPDRDEFKDEVLPEAMPIFGMHFMYTMMGIGYALEDLLYDMEEEERLSGSANVLIANLIDQEMRTQAGVTDLAGNISLSASFNLQNESMTMRARSNNLRFDYDSSVATAPDFQFEDGELVGSVGIGFDLQITGSEDAGGSVIAGLDVGLAFAFTTDEFYGQAVISIVMNAAGNIGNGSPFGVIGLMGRSDEDPDINITASFTVNFYNENGVRQWNWTTNDLEKMLDLLMGWLGGSGPGGGWCHAGNCGCRDGQECVTDYNDCECCCCWFPGNCDYDCDGDWELCEESSINNCYCQ